MPCTVLLKTLPGCARVSFTTRLGVAMGRAAFGCLHLSKSRPSFLSPGWPVVSPPIASCPSPVWNLSWAKQEGWDAAEPRWEEGQ